MKKIIIDNQKIEISDESYENFKKQFLTKKHVDNWSDLPSVDGLIIYRDSMIVPSAGTASQDNRNVFKTTRQAQSAIAMAQLSQLLYEYESAKDVDWTRLDQPKFIIGRSGNEIDKDTCYLLHYFLAFTKSEERDEFYDKHLELIKQYFML